MFIFSLRLPLSYCATYHKIDQRLKVFNLSARACISDYDCEVGDKCDLQFETCVRLPADKLIYDSSQKLKLTNRNSGSRQEIAFIKASKVFSPPDKDKLVKIVSNGNGDRESFAEVSNLVSNEFVVGEMSPNFLSAVIHLSDEYRLGMEQLINLVLNIRVTHLLIKAAGTWEVLRPCALI